MSPLTSSSSFQSQRRKGSVQKVFFILLHVTLLTLISGCVVFKKKCDCPKWGQVNPGLKDHNPGTVTNHSFAVN